MSERFKLVENSSTGYTASNSQQQRAIAVAAALELIAERMSSAPANGTHLEPELRNLSSYADLIQSALEVK
ncbi:MAG: hypothetical protein VYD45_11275 [Pseudomonadota bacterium]|nr:hypothetical protein [Pseudomonadota bacterium]WVM87982.1 hypothetical protein UMZ34_16690 [Halopseudomonas pachastrellae]